MTFETRLTADHFDPAALTTYGKELHVVIFEHEGDTGGPAPCIALEIPERSNNLLPAMVQARTSHARVLLICDTERQANDMAEQATKLLPNHRRVPLERASMGLFGPLQA